MITAVDNGDRQRPVEIGVDEGWESIQVIDMTYSDCYWGGRNDGVNAGYNWVGVNARYYWRGRDDGGDLRWGIVRCGWCVFEG